MFRIGFLIAVWLTLLDRVCFAFDIVEVVPQVGLQGIGLSLKFRTSFNRSDEDPTLDTIFGSLRLGDILLSTMNSTVFDDFGARIVEHTMPNVVINYVGKQMLSLELQLTNTARTSNITREAVSIYGMWVIPGGLTLLPLAVTMIIAVLSRNVLPALFFGVLCAAFLTYEYDLPSSFARSLDSIILTALTQPDNQLVILFAMIMGGFVGVINASSGSIGLANALGTFAKSGRSTQFVTLFFGLLIFFDDYASALILGATLRTIADKMSVSREKFCFLVDSGAAPIAALVPITSWTAFESALLQVEADKLIAQGIPLEQLGYETSGFLGLLRMLKYAYYSIFLLGFQLVLIGTKREYGPMFLAERKALLYGVSDERYDIKSYKSGDEEDEKPPPRCCNAGIPILFFVFYVVIAMVVLGAASVPVHEEVGAHNIFAKVDSITIMYYGAVLATFLAALIYRCQSYTPSSKTLGEQHNKTDVESVENVPPQDGRILVAKPTGVLCLCFGGRKSSKSRPLLTFNQSIEAFVDGFSHLTSTIMILVLAWSIGSAVDFLGAGRFLATALQGNVAPAALPVLIFGIACIVAFATGTSWGTMALLYPICGPVAYVLSSGNPELYYCSLAAILEGSVFGDHCSFISDTTIMSAMACKCPLPSHVITQIPYALFVALVSLLCGYLPIGMQSLAVAQTYFVGFGVTIVGILLAGANPEGDRLDFLNWVSVQIQTKCLRVDPETLPAITLMRQPVGNGIHKVPQSGTLISSASSRTPQSTANVMRRETFDKDLDQERLIKKQEKVFANDEPALPREAVIQPLNPFDFDMEADSTLLEQGPSAASHISARTSLSHSADNNHGLNVEERGDSVTANDKEISSEIPRIRPLTNEIDLS